MAEDFSWREGTALSIRNISTQTVSGNQPPIPFWTEKIKFHDELVDGLIRAPEAHISHHLLANRANCFRRAVRGVSGIFETATT